MLTIGYNRGMTDPEGGVPPEILWNERAAAVYAHGAAEPDVDYWKGADAGLLQGKLDMDRETLDAVQARVAVDVAKIADADAAGVFVMHEYREGVAVWQRLVAWRGFGLHQDGEQIRRLVEASKGLGVQPVGIED